MIPFTGYNGESFEGLRSLWDSHVDFWPFVDGRFAAPPEIDPRPWHRIEDQGAMGSCQGHALSSVCEMAYHIATGDVIQFSRMFAYLTSQEVDGIRGRDVGSTLAGGRKAAMEYGCCPEDQFPYPNPVRYSANIPTHAYGAAKLYRIQSSSVIRSYQDAFGFLASGQGGVEIGIAWPEDLRPNPDGCIEAYRPTGRDGGHAVCFLGYSRRIDGQGRNYLWLANSWGVGHWSADGWAEVSPSVVDQMAAYQGNVMVGLSDLSTPTPRRIDWGDTL